MSYQYETEQDYLDAQFEDTTEEVVQNEDTQNSKRRRKNYSCYPSNDFGTPIRNAITGCYYYNDDEHVIRVGDKEETRFFRVMDATGFNGNKDPNKLYYDCEEDYRTHRK